MKDLLTPLQTLYKESSDILEQFENQAIAVAEKIKLRVFEIIGDPKSYKSKIAKDRIEAGVNFVKAFADVRSFGEKSKAIALCVTFENIIRYCYLDNQAHYKAMDKMPDNLKRLATIQEMAMFTDLNFQAKDELNTLLILWIDLYEAAASNTLYSVHRSNSNNLPERYCIGATKRGEGASIPEYAWKPLIRA